VADIPNICGCSHLDSCNVRVIRALKNKHPAVSQGNTS